MSQRRARDRRVALEPSITRVSMSIASLGAAEDCDATRSPASEIARQRHGQDLAPRAAQDSSVRASCHWRRVERGL